MSEYAPCAEARRVDQHFAGQISPTDERKLRAHLLECAACTAHYERHMVLAACDPTALSADARLARGLGLRGERESRRSWRPAVLAAVAASAAAMAVAVAFVSRPDQDHGFAPRGPASVEETPQLLTYRIHDTRAPELVEGVINADAELAFAYRNPTGYRYLLVFGVDERGNVLWYHPAWTDPATSLAAVAIDSGHAVHELPEAISHPLRTKRLRIHGVFTNEPLSAREIERMVQSAAESRNLPLRGAYQTVLAVELVP